MGCVESRHVLSDVEDEPGRGPKATIPSPEDTGKKKKKDSIRKKSVGQKKALEVGKPGLKSESTKITVIWRRWSTFSSTRDSFKSNKSLEGEAAGPSGKLAQSSQVSSSSG